MAKFNDQINSKQRRGAKIITVNFETNVPRCLSFQLTIIILDYYTVRPLNMVDAKQKVTLQYSQLFFENYELVWLL